MIFKVDHISYSCNSKSYKKLFADYSVSFEETSLKNVDCKREFFKYPRESHDLIMLKKQGEVPVELTVYEGKLLTETNTKLNGSIVNITTSSPRKLIDFYRLLGFEELETQNNIITLKMKAPLDDFTIFLIINESKEAKQIYLDSQGFSSIAFFVDDIFFEKEKIQKAGFFCSDINTVNVDSKNLFVCFARCVGEIVELIALNRNKESLI